jgi:hypothetical protein
MVGCVLQILEEGTRKLSIPDPSHTTLFCGLLSTSDSGVEGQGGLPKK